MPERLRADVILVDTNILVAVANGRDNRHDTARGLLETTPDDLLVAPTVIAEVCYLLSKQAGHGAEVQFLRALGTASFDSWSWPWPT